jgi:hypothetical protein
MTDALGRIEEALGALSRGAAEACTLNLLAIAGDRTALVEQVTRDLLARTFVVRRAPDRDPWLIDGTVRAIDCADCPGDQPVRAALVELTLGDRVAEAARSVVIHLTAPRLGTVFFVAPHGDTQLIGELSPLADHLVTDCAADLHGMLAVCTRSRATVADLSLLRSLRWRELVARCFDGGDPAERLESLDLLQVPGPTGEVVESELLVSWIGAQLGWRASPAGLLAQDGRTIVVRLGRVEIPGAPPGSLQSLALVSGALRGSIRRATDPKHLEWSLEKSGQASLATTVPAGLPPPLHLVSRALATPNRDPSAAGTLRFLARWKGID